MKTDLNVKWHLKVFPATTVIIPFTSGDDRRLGNKRGKKVAFFRQTVAKRSQRRLWVLEIYIMSLNSPKWGMILYFVENFPTV